MPENPQKTIIQNNTTYIRKLPTMIESYQEEVYRKRNAHAIFWFFVFSFAMLLYMFFQGYYFSVEVGFEKLLHTKSTQTTTSNGNGHEGMGDQFIRKFGIISLQLDPIPETFTINDQQYQNGSKQLLDYGRYTLKAIKDGYLPITLVIELSQENPFYLNTINMIREPIEKEFDVIVKKVEKLGTQFIVTTNTSEIYIFNESFGSGSQIEKSYSLSGALGAGTLSGTTQQKATGSNGQASTNNQSATKDGSGKNTQNKNGQPGDATMQAIANPSRINAEGTSRNTNARGGEGGSKNTQNTSASGSIGGGGNEVARYLGEGYYWNGYNLQTINGKLTVTNNEVIEAIKACSDSRMISNDVYCPSKKSFLTGKYQNLKEPVLEANSDFIRTSSMLIRMGGSFFNSSTPITSNATFSGTTKLVTYKNSPMLLSQGILYDIDEGLLPVEIQGLTQVYATKKFGDETVSIGKNLGSPKLIIEDGKNLPKSITLNDDVGENVTIEQHNGAYILLLPKKAVVYYKGSPETTVLASGDILGMFGDKLLYNRDGKTYYLSITEEKK